MKIRLYSLLIVSLLVTFSCSPKNINKYGLTVISKENEYRNLIKKDAQKKMVDVRKYLPAILFDLRYATDDNFMKQQLYPHLQTTYVRLAAAEALKRANEKFLKVNLLIKIFDAYRPYAITEQMWEQVHDARYAADPAKGSGHNRGIAVDMTLLNRDTNKELDMGTGFDNFSDTAHTDFQNLPAHVLQNRKTLINIMEQSGFKSLDTEWWHFYLNDAEKFELLDLSFRQLQRLTE